MIIGHQRQKDILSGMVSSGKIPHAIIFEGLSKLGKRTLAIDFVKKIFCETGNACCKCHSCIDMKKESHPDLLLISPQGKEIQISQIRDLSRKFSFKPYFSFFKAAIIDNAHLMNEESQNSILKILEEPGGNSIIILVTDYPEMFFATIRSRSQRMKFFPVDSKEIESHLHSQGYKGKELEDIILFSFGRPGVAIDFLSDPKKMDFRKEKIKELFNVISVKSPFHLRFRYAKEMAEDPEKAKELLEIWLSYFRILLLKKAEGVNGIKYSFLKMRDSLKIIEEAIYLISRTNANTKMVLESLLMEL